MKHTPYVAITLPIIFDTEESSQIEKLGLRTKNSLDATEIRPMIFYDLSCLSQSKNMYKGEEIDMCHIYSGGDVFVTPLSMREVNDLWMFAKKRLTYTVRFVDLEKKVLSLLDKSGTEEVILWSV